MGRSHMKLDITFALFECLENADYASVSTVDIIEAAGCSKRTFYNHFRDKYDIIQWYWDYSMQEYLNSPQHVYYHKYLELINNNYNAFSKIMEYLGQNNFFDFFVEYESKKYRQHISRNIYKKYPAALVDHAVTYSVQAAYFGTVLNMTSAEDFNDFVNRTLTNSTIPIETHSLAIFDGFLSSKVLPAEEHI